MNLRRALQRVHAWLVKVSTVALYAMLGLGDTCISFVGVGEGLHLANGALGHVTEVSIYEWGAFTQVIE